MDIALSNRVSPRVLYYRLRKKFKPYTKDARVTESARATQLKKFKQLPTQQVLRNRQKVTNTIDKLLKCTVQVLASRQKQDTFLHRDVDDVDDEDLDIDTRAPMTVAEMKEWAQRRDLRTYLEKRTKPGATPDPPYCLESSPDLFAEGHRMITLGDPGVHALAAIHCELYTVCYYVYCCMSAARCTLSTVRCLPSVCALSAVVCPLSAVYFLWLGYSAQVAPPRL